CRYRQPGAGQQQGGTQTDKPAQRASTGRRDAEEIAAHGLLLSRRQVAVYRAAAGPSRSHLPGATGPGITASRARRASERERDVFSWQAFIPAQFLVPARYLGPRLVEHAPDSIAVGGPGAEVGSKVIDGLPR